jgi:hypothetical protein
MPRCVVRAKTMLTTTCLTLGLSLLSTAYGAQPSAPRGAALLILDLRVKEVEALAMTDCYPLGDSEWRDPSQNWLSSVPDSLITRATWRSTKVQVRAHCDDTIQTVRIMVYDACDLVRSTSSTTRGGGMRSLWTWDLRDSTGHRVPDGIYRIEASVGSRSSAGWAVVGSPDSAH